MFKILAKLRSEQMSKFNLARHEKMFYAKLSPQLSRAFVETGYVLQSQPKRSEDDKQLEISVVLDLKTIASDLNGHMIIHFQVDFLIYRNQLSVVNVSKAGFDAREIGPDEDDTDLGASLDEGMSKEEEEYPEYDLD